MIEVVENPSFKPEDFDPAGKKPGITAILRLRNEAEYLETAMRSILPFFDEFVIVYNQCTDRTPELVERFANQEPKRVRAFHYVPEAVPPTTHRHAATPASQVQSFVHYSNFALSKVSHRVCLLWDGDMIAAPEPLTRILEGLRAIKPRTLAWWRSPWRLGWWWFSGVNLWDRDDKIFVPRTWPRAFGNKDHGFWPVTPRNIFRHHPRVELLNTRWLMKTFVGFVYFHVKGMKKDRGLSPHLSLEMMNPVHKERFEKHWTNPELITFEEYCRIEPAASCLPDPESLGIRPVRG
jgi:glycosyltransferase involved in cell wall biosynthesis